MIVDVELSDVARALGDSVRMRIVELLSSEDLCVCHLSAELDLAQPLVSHHLRVLRDAGLVEGDRFRYWTYYSLRAEGLRGLADRLGRMSSRRRLRVRRPCS